MYYPRYNIFANDVKSHMGNKWFTVAELPPHLKDAAMVKKCNDRGLIEKSKTRDSKTLCKRWRVVL